MINLKFIKKLKPCQDRLDNYLKFYSDKEFTPRQFMGLKNITQEDKLWVAFRSLPEKTVRIIAGEIAMTVLHIYEEKYPEDFRPRKAIEFALKGESNINAANAAANAAADADYAAAKSAAYAAADAVYYSTYAAYAATHAAANAAKANPGLDQEKLIRTIILKYWKE